MKKKLVLGLQILLSLVLLGWVLSLVPADSWHALAAAPLHYVALAVIAMVSNQALCAIRLYRLLRGALPETQFSLIFKSTWLGFFCSSFLPSSVGGDIVKFAWLSKSLGNSATILAGMVVERVLNLGLTVSIACVFLMQSTFRLGYLSTGRGIVWLLTLGVAGLALCCVAGVWATRSQHRYATLLRAYANQLREALRNWQQAPWRLLETVFWSGAAYIIAGIGVLAPTTWAAGADISSLQAIGCIATATLLTLIPVTINGIGVYEAGLAGLLVVASCSPEVSAQVAILMRIVTTLAALPGACWLRFNQLVRQPMSFSKSPTK